MQATNNITTLSLSSISIETVITIGTTTMTLWG